MFQLKMGEIRTYLVSVQVILLLRFVVTIVTLVNSWMYSENVSLHIIDVVALVITRFAHVHPLFTVDFNIMSLEIVFIGAPATFTVQRRF